MGSSAKILPQNEGLANSSKGFPGVTTLEKEDFFHRGFFVRPQAFVQEEVEVLRRQFDALQEQAQRFTETTEYRGSQFVVEGARIDRIVWACGSAPRLLSVARDLRLSVPCAQLLGSIELHQIICQAHYKLPGDEVSFPWHQDSQHRGYGTERWVDVNQQGSFVQTLVAVDDTPIDSGPVYFIENTVEAGHLALDMEENITKYVEPDKAKPVILQAGDVVFFHPFAIHGSRANRSSRSRRVFINGFAHPGANNFAYPGCGLGDVFRVPDDALNPSQE